MKNLILNIKNAIFGGDYARDFGKKTFWQASGYLLILLFIESIVFSFVLLDFVPNIYKFVNENKVENIIKENISEDDEIILKDGKISTSDGEAVLIPIPQGIKEDLEKDLDNDNQFEYLVVVDPTTVDPLASMREYKTLILANSDQILVVDDEGIKVMNASDFPNIVINQDNIISKYNEIKPYIKTGIFIIPIAFVVFLTIFALMAYWLFALLAALILMLIAKIKKIKVNYQTAYIISLFAFTLPIIIDTVTDIFRHNLGFWWTMLIIAILAFVNLKGKK